MSDPRDPAPPAAPADDLAPRQNELAPAPSALAPQDGSESAPASSAQSVEPAAAELPALTAPPAPLPVAPLHEPEKFGDRPTFVFFGIVASVSLLADVCSKAWAEIALSRRFDEPSIVLIDKHLSFTLAYNKGGAWGLLQDAPESVRRPFFFAVSVLAVLFIVSLYSKIGKGQRALAWGLPLVLGGALGNLSDRVTRSSVIDFIDYRAEWVLAMNRAILKAVPGWGVTDHWPTFNVADIAICMGVGLMAVDMFTSRRAPEHAASPPLGPAVGT
jgi:lipoprotein signal peptidase